MTASPGRPDDLVSPRPEVLTVKEVADYLRIPCSSVYKLAKERRIPCQKAGRQWRFHRQAIDGWLSSLSQLKTNSHDDE